MPGRRSITKGSAKITYKLDRDGVRRELVSFANTGGTVQVAERPVEVLIDAPVVKQVYPNNCETAALEMLLATEGVEKSQRRLQRMLRHDGPLDPRTTPDGWKLWGNKLTALAELHRVLRPGGRLVLADMMFTVSQTDARDRGLIKEKVKALMAKGPGGAWRLARNAGRYLTGRWERPASGEWWRSALADTGFTRVDLELTHHEGGIVEGHR